MFEPTVSVEQNDLSWFVSIDGTLPGSGSSQPDPINSHNVVATIGFYDGVHRGHKYVLETLKEEAKKQGLSTAVVTFDVHPLHVIAPEKAPLLLTEKDTKVSLLRDEGIDRIVMVSFTQRVASQEPEDFVQELLVDFLHVGCIVIGEDFRFGKNRRGDVELLRELGKKHNFTVLAVPLMGNNQKDSEYVSYENKISSTAIRHAIQNGNIVEANEQLGRCFALEGVVVAGDSRARQLGFPTANVALSPLICLPQDGVYAGWAQTTSGEYYESAISLGRRTTFYSDQSYSLLEAHLLNFQGDLYDSKLKIYFALQIRLQKTFSHLDELQEQIKKDCESVSALLAEYHPPR